MKQQIGSLKFSLYIAFDMRYLCVSFVKFKWLFSEYREIIPFTKAAPIEQEETKKEKKQKSKGKKDVAKASDDAAATAVKNMSLSE